MVQITNKRSNYLIEKARKYWMEAAFFAVGILCFSSIFYFIKDYSYSIWVSLATPLLITVLFIYRALKYQEKRGDNYDKGDNGEIKIEEILKNLPDTYFVFPDIKKTPNSNIDFVVVGPTGIYALEVKNHKYARIGFDGKHLTSNSKYWGNKDDLSQTINNATFLGEYLKNKMNNKSLFVKPVLVFTGRMDLHFGFKKVKKVAQVICKEYLIELLTSEKSIFSDKYITSIVEELNVLNQNNGFLQK